MKILDGDTLLTLKEASERFSVPTYWFRRQIGKPRLPNGGIVRAVKFPNDKNYYMYLSELEQLAKPMIFNPTFVGESQKEYDANPETMYNDTEKAASTPDYDHENKWTKKRNPDGTESWESSPRQEDASEEESKK